jgi:hypothetical protein
MGLVEIYCARDAQAAIIASCLSLSQNTPTCLSMSTTRCVTLLYHLYEISYQIAHQYDSSLYTFAPSSFLQFHPDRNARATIPTLYPGRRTALPLWRPSASLTRHYNLIQPICSMSTPMAPEAFPPEVWLRILDYSTPSVYRAMSQLSSTFHQLSRKRLYDTIVFGNQVYLGVTRGTAYEATWCRDLKLFYALHKDRNEWKSFVHRVYVQCCKLIFCNAMLSKNEIPLATW